MNVAATAKSLQSCPTLCDPIDGNPPGSPVPGILQARTLEWVAISFSNAWKRKNASEVAQSCLTLSDPMDCSLPGSSVHLYLKGDGSKYCVECSITISFGVVETASSPITTSFNRMNYMLLYKFVLSDQIRSDQLLSRVRLFATPWIAARLASLSITNSRSSLRLTSIESVMPSSHLILCGPLLLLPPIPPSIRVFSNESTLRVRWPKYWSFSFSIIPSKEIPGLRAKLSVFTLILDMLSE